MKSLLAWSSTLSALLCVGYALYFFQEVLIPFIFSLVLSFVLRPLVDCLSPSSSGEEAPLLNRSSAKLPRSVAVTCTILFVLSSLTGSAFLVYLSARPVASKAPEYVQAAHILVGRLEKSFPFLQSDLEGQLITSIRTWAKEIPPFLLQSMFFYFQKCLLITIFLIYLLLSPMELKKGSVPATIYDQVRQYLFLKGGVSVVVGLAQYLILFYLGVDCALLFGFITIVSNFVPNVGPLFASILPLPLILLNLELTVLDQVMAIALPIVVHTIVGNVVEPALMGDSFEIHPVVIILALIFWALIWGTSGMVLAVPTMAVIRIVLLHLNSPSALYIGRCLEGRI
eukprot:NODE_2142_length_1281_cov_20.434253_g1949_i0.p1 GENE.NODE_2142_length_1281_cov_20.434253_g1949_i0~~NODE_2142_length_1281_cov_20.434253_g1949_i0.p1  ORF type:complete len:341 (-),score=26.54 NODE_2142_length_1281_cov_20.434253_g1949_i0:203-1225(-)